MRTRIVVLLVESMLRITPGGVWVNRASVTAIAERLTHPLHRWGRVGPGPSWTWHEHRLAPPPFGDRRGEVASFAIPATVNGRPVAALTSFVGEEPA